MYQFLLLVATCLQASLAYPSNSINDKSNYDYDSTLKAIQYGLTAEKALEDQLDVNKQDAFHYQGVELQNLQDNMEDERLTDFLDNEEYSALQTDDQYDYPDEYYSVDINELKYNQPDYNRDVFDAESDDQNNIYEQILLDSDESITEETQKETEEPMKITEGQEEETEKPLEETERLQDKTEQPEEIKVTTEEPPKETMSPEILVTESSSVLTIPEHESEPTSEPALNPETNPIPGIMPTLATTTESPKKIIRYCYKGQRSTVKVPCIRLRLPWCRHGQKSTIRSPCRPRLKVCKPGQRSTPIKRCIPLTRIKQCIPFRWIKKHWHRIYQRLKRCRPGQTRTRGHPCVRYRRCVCFRNRRQHRKPHQGQMRRNKNYQRRRGSRRYRPVPKNHGRHTKSRRFPQRKMRWKSTGGQKRAEKRWQQRMQRKHRGGQKRARKWRQSGSRNQNDTSMI